MANPCAKLFGSSSPCGKLETRSSCADCGFVANPNSKPSTWKCPCEDISSGPPTHSSCRNHHDTQTDSPVPTKVEPGPTPKSVSITSDDSPKEEKRLGIWQWILSLFGLGPKSEEQKRKHILQSIKEETVPDLYQTQEEHVGEPSGDSGDDKKNQKFSTAERDAENDRLPSKYQSVVVESRPKKKKRSKSADPKNRNKYLGRPLEPLSPSRLKRRSNNTQASPKKAVESGPKKKPPSIEPQTRPPISPVYSSAKYLVPYSPNCTYSPCQKKEATEKKTQDKSKEQGKIKSPTCVERLLELQRAMSCSPPCLACPCPCPTPCPPKCPPPWCPPTKCPPLCCPPPRCPPPCPPPRCSPPCPPLCPPPCPPPCPPTCCPPPCCADPSITSLMRKRCPSPKTCGPRSKSFSASPRCVNECVQQFKEEMKMKRKKGHKCPVCCKSPTKGTGNSPCCCTDPCPPPCIPPCPPPCPEPCPPACPPSCIPPCPSPCSNPCKPICPCSSNPSAKQNACCCTTCFKPTFPCSPKYVPKHPPCYRSPNSIKAPKPSDDCGICPITCMKPCCVPLLNFASPCNKQNTGPAPCYPCPRTHVPPGGGKSPISRSNFKAPACNVFCNPSCVQSLAKSKDNDAYCKFLMAKYNVSIPEYPPLCPMPVSSCPLRVSPSKRNPADNMQTTCDPSSKPPKRMSGQDTTQNHTSNPTSPEKQKEAGCSAVHFNTSPSKTEHVSQFRLPKRTPVECIRERGPRSPVREYVGKLGLPNKKERIKSPIKEEIEPVKEENFSEAKPAEDGGKRSKKKTKGRAKKQQLAEEEAVKTEQPENVAEMETVVELEPAQQNMSENKASSQPGMPEKSSQPVISSSPARQSPTELTRRYKRAKHTIRDISKISFPVKEYSSNQERQSAENSSFYRKFLGVSPKSKVKHDVLPFIVDGGHTTSPPSFQTIYKTSPKISRSPMEVTTSNLRNSPPLKGKKLRSPSPVSFSTFPIAEQICRPSALNRSSTSPKQHRRHGSRSPKQNKENTSSIAKKTDSPIGKCSESQRMSRKRKASKSPRKNFADEGQIKSPVADFLQSTSSKSTKEYKRRQSRSVSPRGRKRKSSQELPAVEINPFLHFGITSPEAEPGIIDSEKQIKHENLTTAEQSKRCKLDTIVNDDLEQMMTIKFPMKNDDLSPRKHPSRINDAKTTAVQVQQHNLLNIQGADNYGVSIVDGDSMHSSEKTISTHSSEKAIQKKTVSATRNNRMKMAIDLLYLKARWESSVDPDVYFEEDGESSVDPDYYRWKQPMLRNHTRLEGWILNSKESSVDRVIETERFNAITVNNSSNNSNIVKHGDEDSDKSNGALDNVVGDEDVLPVDEYGPESSTNYSSNNNDQIGAENSQINESSETEQSHDEDTNKDSKIDINKSTEKSEINIHPQNSSIAEGVKSISSSNETSDPETPGAANMEDDKPSALMELLRSSGVKWQKVGPATDTDISILRLASAAHRGVAKNNQTPETSTPPGDRDNTTSRKTINNTRQPMFELLKCENGDEEPHLSCHLLKPVDDKEGSILSRYKNM